jgi:hypothetical protein
MSMHRPRDWDGSHNCEAYCWSKKVSDVNGTECAIVIIRTDPKNYIIQRQVDWTEGSKRTYLKECSKDLGPLSPMTPDMTWVHTIALITSLFLPLTKKNYVSRKLFPLSVSAAYLSIPCAHRSCREVNLLMLVSSYGITFAQRGW